MNEKIIDTLVLFFIFLLFRIIDIGTFLYARAPFLEHKGYLPESNIFFNLFGEIGLYLINIFWIIFAFFWIMHNVKTDKHLRNLYFVGIIGFFSLIGAVANIFALSSLGYELTIIANNNTINYGLVDLNNFSLRWINVT